MPTRLRALITAAALFAAACGGSSGESGSEADTDLLGGDIVLQGDVTLGEDAIATTTSTTTTTPTDGAAGAAEGGDEGGNDDTAGFEETGDTIPQNVDDSPQAQADSMFSALRIFNDCLEDEGTTFIGDPRTAEPGSPAADPGYLESLGKCAALSNIVDAMTSLQEASENLTQEEILERNEGLVVWQDCMEGRGWTMTLAADDRGLLNPTDMQGPGDETPLDSDDMQECANSAIDEAEAGE